MSRALAFIALAAALAAGGYWLGQRQAHQQMVATPAGAQASAPQMAAAAASAPKTDASGRRILYWHDPMYPQQRFDKPGKSPFMNMELVPVYADDKAAEGGVAVSARVRQSLGMRTASAEVTTLGEEISAVGYVLADERRIARAEVRAQGWVERLHARAVNDPVQAGQTLAEIYSPELYAAQEEYLLARRMAQASPADAPLAGAARTRLELLGMPAAEIVRLESSGAASRRVPVLAPISGVLSELGVREGAMVQAGTPAFTITDLSSVWIAVEVPETQAAVLRPGLRAEASVQTLPGRRFGGSIDFIYPELNVQTRTVKARATLANPGLALKPGMFATVRLLAGVRKALTVPSEAVIQTGTRSVVVVAEGEHFRATTVKIGAETGERSEILSGLKAGDRVVASGQFLIDSEASLRTTLSRLDGPEAVAGRHRGRGKVTDVHIAMGMVELEHEPIASLKWPAMTMEFTLADKSVLRTLKRGEAVEFELADKPDPSGNWVIQKLTRKGAP